MKRTGRNLASRWRRAGWIALALLLAVGAWEARAAGRSEGTDPPAGVAPGQGQPRATSAAVTYEVRGVVRDAAGAPVAGVTVRSDQGQRATTAADGRYVLGGLPPGDHTLSASGLDRGYFPAARRVTVPPNVVGQNFTALEAGQYGGLALFLPVIRK